MGGGGVAFPVTGPPGPVARACRRLYSFAAQIPNGIGQTMACPHLESDAVRPAKKYFIGMIPRIHTVIRN
jgi:hypothetical protein